MNKDPWSSKTFARSRSRGFRATFGIDGVRALFSLTTFLILALSVDAVLARTPAPRAPASSSSVNWFRQQGPSCLTRAGHTSVVYKNQIWVIGGWDRDLQSTNTVCSSSDGQYWTEVPLNPLHDFTPRYGHASVVFNDQMWVIGGWDQHGPESDVYSSFDGETWTQVTAAAGFSARVNHSCVVYDGRMWVIGGSFDQYYTNYHDVWWSTNGSDWFRATDDAPFGPRCGHSCTVYNGKMWVIGGVDTTYFNDVWSSTNGIDWTPLENFSYFKPRACHATVVFHDLLWLIGGWGGWEGVPLNDVWTSADAILWNPSPTPAGFASERASCVVFNDQILSLGGLDGNQVISEIWTTNPSIPLQPSRVEEWNQYP